LSLTTRRSVCDGGRSPAQGRARRPAYKLRINKLLSVAREQISSRTNSGLQEEADGDYAIFGHEAVMHGLHVVLHLVRPGELLAADRARKHFPLVALVVEEGVTLEAVLIFESLDHVGLFTLYALVHALGDGRVAEQVESSDRHLGQLLCCLVGARRPPARTPTHVCLGRRRRCGHVVLLQGPRFPHHWVAHVVLVLAHFHRFCKVVLN